MKIQTTIDGIKRFVRHNQALVFGIIASLILAVWFIGCASKTTSLLDPGRKVTQLELNTEYEHEMQRLESELKTIKVITEARIQDLHRQDALKQALYNHAFLLAAGGNPNPLGLISTVAAILGVGAIVDNRRKDGVIKGLTSDGT